MNGAVTGCGDARAQGVCEERAELVPAHLAGGHRELAVAPVRVGVPADRDIVRRVEKGSVDLHAFPDDAVQERAVATVSAAKAMVAEDPDVIRSGLWRRSCLREMIVVRIVRTRKGDIDLPRREAREAEIEIHVGEIAKLQLQEIEIPARTERDLVVGQSQHALLPIAQSPRAQWSEPPRDPPLLRRATARAPR